jgi:hypothetical protein
MTMKSAMPTAARVGLVLLGAKAAKSFVGDGREGLRDLAAELAGGFGGFLLANKVL